MSNQITQAAFNAAYEEMVAPLNKPRGYFVQRVIDEQTNALRQQTNALKKRVEELQHELCLLTSVDEEEFKEHINAAINAGEISEAEGKYVLGLFNYNKPVASDPAPTSDPEAREGDLCQSCEIGTLRGMYLGRPFLQCTNCWETIDQ